MAVCMSIPGRSLASSLEREKKIEVSVPTVGVGCKERLSISYLFL